MVEASTRVRVTPDKRLELAIAAWRDGAALAAQPRVRRTIEGRDEGEWRGGAMVPRRRSDDAEPEQAARVALLAHQLWEAPPGAEMYHQPRTTGARQIRSSSRFTMTREP